MRSFFISGRDPFDVLGALLEKSGCTCAQSVRDVVDVALESGFFDGAQKFYGFHDFEHGVLEFGVHKFHSHDPWTGEVPPDVCYLEIVGCGGKPPPAEPAARQGGVPPEPYYPDDWTKAEGAIERLDISMHK